MSLLLSELPIQFQGVARAIGPSTMYANFRVGTLAAALRLYMELIASRPNDPEAGYSRAQIRNIINAVVPAQELLDAQIGLALARLNCSEST